LYVLLPFPLQQQFLLWFFSIRNKIPDAVLFQQTGSIRTLSESGLMFKAMILYFLIIFMSNQFQKLCHPYKLTFFLKNASFDRLAFFIIVIIFIAGVGAAGVF
jgi:hypothetical protein